MGKSIIERNQYKERTWGQPTWTTTLPVILPPMGG